MRTTIARAGRWGFRAGSACLLALSLAVGWNFLSGNFAEVIPGEVYRSAQLRASGLAATVRDYRVKTVLNLRGHHPESSWYRAERAATLSRGATQVDIALSSCIWMSRAQLRTLVDVLRTSETPILIHCSRGAERTGIASAFASLLREGSTLADAHAQFSAARLFLPIGDGVMTLRHLEAYEGWLAGRGEVHSPAAFLRWVDEGFIPGVPGREEWPSDPYPLVVTTRPGPGGPVERATFDPRGRPTAEAAIRAPEDATR